MNHYYYFSFESVPAATLYKLWFAARSPDQARIEWTEQQPPAPDPGAPWIVGVEVSQNSVPTISGVPVLAKLSTSIKDVPPPPTLQAVDVSAKGFGAAFEEAFSITSAKSYRP